MTSQLTQDREVLEAVIAKSELLLKEKKLAAQGNLAIVLVHDLLLNKSGIVSNAGPFKDAVMRHKTRLKAEWIKAKIRLKVKDNVSMAKTDQTFLPRWARINTLRTSKEACMKEFEDFAVVTRLEDLKLKSIFVDDLVDDLIAFHPDQPLTSHKHYLNGFLILQNKASCIPAAVLNPPKGASVIDACAAPGNKTSHLAAILQGSGNLIAFERDNKRVLVLKDMLAKAGAQADVIHQDFTRADPHDPKFANVTHLLLDPSCSGSGIVNRLDYLTNTTEPSENETAVQDQDRLDALSSFQFALLMHAMKFPAAEKITYSTCSIHAVENEHVVMEALRKSPDWRIAPASTVLPDWPVRGLLKECNDDEEVANSLIRANPGQHGTIGFFVACFVKSRPEKRLFLDDPDAPRKAKRKRKKARTVNEPDRKADEAT